MNKPFPQSPGSVGSSETSETQSITDEPINRTSSKGSGSKKSKESQEKERPPWRAVSLATPSKADKNALLKAKILDATRRALISQRIAHQGCQTDPIPTKLMRDVELDAPKDLILMTDQQQETDGSVTIKKECAGGFILTQTVGQMTDGTLYNDIGTQTARPNINVSFKKYLKHENLYTTDTHQHRFPNHQNIDDILNNNQLVLQAQINELQKLDGLLMKSSKTKTEDEKSATSDDKLPVERSEEDTDDETMSIDSLHDQNGKSVKFKKNAISLSYYSEFPFNQEEGNINENNPKTSSTSDEKKRHILKDSFLNVPTLTSWEDFDLSDEDDIDDLPNLPRTTMSTGQSPWYNFKDIVIGQRLANMHLSPIPPRRPSLKKKSVTWSDSQHRAIVNLISEASALMDVFDNVSLLLGPDIQPSSVTSQQILETNYRLPPSKWDPILTKSCQLLEKQIKNFKPRQFGSSDEQLRIATDDDISN